MSQAPKVLIVFGTRPEAIKMAPVVKGFQAAAPQLQTVVCVTAQHREMLDQVLRLFDITANIAISMCKPARSTSRCST
jgi:UDP-N-acetylglucosamine 2-epimerase (non-hydrolysing)